MKEHQLSLFAVYGTVAVIMTASVLFGISLAFPALTISSIQKEFKLSEFESTMFSALTALLAIAGPYTFQPFMEKKGRRFALRIIGFSSVLCYLVFCLSSLDTKFLIFIHRGSLGIIIGGISSIAPVYLVELASPAQKNVFGSLNQLGISTGVALANLLGGVLEWRTFAWVNIFVASFISVMSFFIPESPAFLNLGKSKKSYANLYDGNYNHEIFDGILFMFFQQFSGINGLLTNAGAILDGSSSAATFAASAQCIACVFCSSAISKLGTKWTWIVSCSGALLSLVLLAMSQYMHFGLIFNGIAVFGFQLSFGFGLGPVPWLMTPMLFPDKVRSSASSLLSSINWLLAFIVISIFPTMMLHFGLNTSALMFAGVMVAGIGFGCKIVQPAEEEEVEFEAETVETMEAHEM